MTDDQPETPNTPAHIITEFTPVPRRRMRKGGWSAARQREFIDWLARTGSVRAACRAMGVGEYGIYDLRRHPEGASFRAAWEAALDIGVQRLEDVAMDRALNGVEEPVFRNGEQIGTRTVYNDRLLMFILNNRAANRFAAHGKNPTSIMDRALLARLKKEWRSEWERERAILDYAEEEDAMAEIMAKLAAMRAREEEVAALLAQADAPDDEAEEPGGHGPSEEMKKLLPGYRAPVEEDERAWRGNAMGERWRE